MKRLRKGIRRKNMIRKSTIIGLLAIASPAAANGVGENISWQFQTSADRVNKVYTEDMRQKKRSGYYSPPNITNIIDKQFNCSLSASSTGNIGSNGLTNTGPATSGNLATAKGNESRTDVNERAIGDSSLAISTYGSRYGPRKYWNGFEWVSNSTWDDVNGVSSDVLQDQSNLGAVTATTTGDVSSINGNSENYQALNSTQENPGTQTSNVNSSTACEFASVE